MGWDGMGWKGKGKGKGTGKGRGRALGPLDNGPRREADGGGGSDREEEGEVREAGERIGASNELGRTGTPFCSVSIFICANRAFYVAAHPVTSVLRLKAGFASSGTS